MILISCARDSGCRPSLELRPSLAYAHVHMYYRVAQFAILVAAAKSQDLIPQHLILIHSIDLDYVSDNDDNRVLKFAF